MNSLQVRCSLLLLAVALCACPTVPEADPLEPRPTILSFTSSAPQADVGQQVKLSWSVENATSLKLEELKLGALSGIDGNQGSVDVTITSDSFFVLTARNARGASDTAVVAVGAGAALGDLLLAALPGVIEAGTPVTIAWSAPSATAVTLTANPGGSIDVAGQTEVGTIIVNPAATTTYTLTAGVRTATATVTVQPTLVRFEATPLSADAGSTVTLSWETANATRVQLSAPGRGTLFDSSDAAQVAAGQFDDALPAVVDPGQLFTYQLEVTGPGRTLKAEQVVTINGNPSVLTFVVPKYASSSDAGVTLTWTTREAAAVSIASNGVEFYRAPPGLVGSGAVIVPTPAGDTTFTLTARGARGGSATRSGVVDVVGQPTVTLTATPNSVAQGATAAFSWSGTDVRNVRISSPLGGTLFTAVDVMDTGMATNPAVLAQTATFRIDVDNGAGQTAFATATVTVTNPFTLTQPAGSVRAGELVNLSWPSGEVTGLPHADVVVRPSPDGGTPGFEDISSTGAALSFPSGDGVVTFKVKDFQAPFFDRFVGDELWVASDGFLSFSAVGTSPWSAVALPSSKLEPYSIAPCWADRSPGTLYWQVKPQAPGKVLVVQWATDFQVKLFSSGQIDFEYRVAPSCTGRGVRGPYGNSGFGTPAAIIGQGVTLFGPKTGSAVVALPHERRLLGSTVLAGQQVYLEHNPGAVVQFNELFISEAMVSPHAALGAAGQWFELHNTRSTPIDLTGWTLSVTDGGVVAPLSGTIAAGSVVVAGASLDPALNGDAGVTIALTGLDPGIDAGLVQLGRDGGLSNFAWSAPTPGTALVADFGLYRFDGDTTAARPQVCPATATFGNLTPAQFGTPGVPGSCGFPYTWHELPGGGFFDISKTGTIVTIIDPLYDEETIEVPLTGAPFTYFGTPHARLSVSTNGFVSFDGTARNSKFLNNYPSSTDVNAVLAPFTADLFGNSFFAEIYTQRVGANVDPAAAAPHWVIQWFHWTTMAASGDDLNFQIKLFDDGTIEYHYGRMQSESSTRYGTGIGTVTWLENPTGSQALVLNTRSYSPGLSSFTGFRFSPR